MKKVFSVLIAMIIFSLAHADRAQAVNVLPQHPPMMEAVEFYEFSGRCTLDCAGSDDSMGRVTLGLVGDTSGPLTSENFYSFEYDVNPGHSTVLDMLPIIFPAFPGAGQPFPFQDVFLTGSIPDGGGPANVSLSFPYHEYLDTGDGGIDFPTLLAFQSLTNGDWSISTGECGFLCPDDAGNGGVWTTPTTVPEPASLVLLGIGLVSIAVVSRRRRLS